MQQLNFITGYDGSPVPKLKSQLELWDVGYKNAATNPETWRSSTIERFFSELDYSIVPAYEAYWNSIAPKNDSEILQRWLFAFMSVHTSWKANIVGYQAIKNWWCWLNKWDSLLEAIQGSRVGMHNIRVKYIAEFAYKFWENPGRYKKTADETWVAFRNRLKHATLGLGPAKTSFALEMCYPTEAKLACLDTHMFQAYGLDQVKDAKQYDKIEMHWVDMCTMWRIPPYVARCIYWDLKQGYPDSRYWSSVLEQ
jgi:hypothetical protein